MCLQDNEYDVHMSRDKSGTESLTCSSKLVITGRWGRWYRHILLLHGSMSLHLLMGVLLKVADELIQVSIRVRVRVRVRVNCQKGVVLGSQLHGQHGVVIDVWWNCGRRGWSDKLTGI